jgi:hypothetical protein
MEVPVAPAFDGSGMFVVILKRKSFSQKPPHSKKGKKNL